MSEFRRRCRAGCLVYVWLLLCGLGSGAAALAQAAPSFAAATAAFEAQDYGEALSAFQALRAAGEDSAALRYNIGVCQYRLRDYAAAAATFAELAAAFPAMATIAEYNRALALVGLGRDEDARTAFERVAAGDDERLAALAAAALGEIARPPPGRDVTAAPRSSTSYLSFNLGRDDNVALFDDPVVRLGESASSSLVEALGYAERRFEGVPLRLNISGYVVRYPDAQAFDQDWLRVAALFEHRGERWRWAGGPQAAYSTLGGDGFERSAGVTLEGSRPFGARGLFDIRLLYDDLAAPSPLYVYLDGSRVRVRFGVERRAADGGRVRFTYEHETQERAAANVSPERDRLALAYSHRVAASWWFEGLVAMRHGRFDELATPRTEDLVEGVVSMRRELASQWQLDTEARWTDNDASVAAYSYRSLRFAIGLSRSF